MIKFNRKSHSKTPLLLMELIICILFFALTGTVCIMLFVKAHVVAQNSVDLTNGTLIAQNAAEIFTGQNGNSELIRAVYSDNAEFPDALDKDSKNTLIMLFDKDWKEIDHPLTVSHDDSSYEMIMSITNSGATVSADINIIKLSSDEPVTSLSEIKKEKIIYTLNTKRYISSATKQ